MRELTYMKIYRNQVNDEGDMHTMPIRTFFLASSRRSARSHARWTVCHSASERGWPDVVVAVTRTLIIIAGGKMPCRSTFVGSSEFPRARTDRMYICGSATSCSSSGNLGA